MIAVSSPIALHPEMSSPNGPIPTDPGQAATSFANLLDAAKGDNRERRTAPSHRAYNFAELGMFGLHASEFEPDQPAKVSARPASLAHTSASARNSAAAQTISAQHPLIYVPSLSGDSQANISTQVSSPLRVNVAPAMRYAGGNGMALSKAPTPETGTSPEGSARAVVPKKMDIALIQAREPVAVAVSGPDDALKVVVRSTGEPTPEVVRMRRLIESTVAQFEMTLSELHFNGQAASPVFSIGGGMNGGSAR